MALADPQSVTINGTAISLPRVLTGTEQGKFVAADGLTTVTVDPSISSRSKRQSLRINQRKVMTDPLVSTTNVVKGITVTLNVQRDLDGYSDADAKKVLTGFLTWAQSAGVVDAFLSGQN